MRRCSRHYLLKQAFFDKLTMNPKGESDAWLERFAGQFNWLLAQYFLLPEPIRGTDSLGSAIDPRP